MLEMITDMLKSHLNPVYACPTCPECPPVIVEVPQYLIALSLVYTIVPIACSVIAMALLVECARLRRTNKRIERDNVFMRNNESLVNTELARLQEKHDERAKECAKLRGESAELRAKVEAIVELNMQDNAAYEGNDAADETAYIPDWLCIKHK